MSRRDRAVLGRERRTYCATSSTIARIGLRRDFVSAEMFGNRHDAERNRHPSLDCGARPAHPVALDPHQFGGAAADVEQDGAAPLGIEQRRAADHGQRRFRLAVDHLELDAGLGSDAFAESSAFSAARQASVAISRSRPAFRSLILSLQIDSAAIARSIAASLIRAGRGDALAEPDDAREGVDHAEPVARGTGDQQPAVVGAEVERRIDARCPPPPQPARPGPREAHGRREAAYDRSSIVFPRPASRHGITVRGNLSSADARRNPSQRPCPIGRCRAATGGLSGRKAAQKPRKTSHFR